MINVTAEGISLSADILRRRDTMTKDRTTGLIALVLGIAVAIATSQLPPSTMANDIGPKVFPFISAGLLIICGAGLLLTGTKKEEKAAYTKPELIRLGTIFGVVLGYCVLMSIFGYVIASIVACFVLSVMFGRRKQIPWYRSLIFAVILTLIVYYIFEKVFILPLPRGMIF